MLYRMLSRRSRFCAREAVRADLALSAASPARETLPRPEWQAGDALPTAVLARAHSTRNEREP